MFHDYERAHGRYWYQRQVNSVFGGYCETTVVVSNGVVQSRKQVNLSYDSRVPESWIETGADIGSRDGCHPAVAMDALYDECLNQVLCNDPRDNYISVQVDARGLLVLCGFTPKNCADDCYSGIESLILTADGTDWTEVGAQCCPISPQPDCCMEFGGARGASQSCGTACDGMAAPGNPIWRIFFDGQGCPVWSAPENTPDCCGCPRTPDAGTP